MMMIRLTFQNFFSKSGPGLGIWPFRIALVPLVCLMTSACVHWPDIDENCEAYGVVETNRPIASRVHVRALPHDQLQEVCSLDGGAKARISGRFIVKGCVVPTGNDSVYAYHSIGDRCAQLHEICHARHGIQHTQAYMQDLYANRPSPYCPRNQLTLASR